MMEQTNGPLPFGVLARQVFDWDAAIRWIALDEPGRQLQLEWRDRGVESAVKDITPEQPVIIDPLLLMLAEDRQDIYNRDGSADPHRLRFVVLAYGDRAQIVARLGQYGHLNIGIGSTGDAYRIGARLAGLFTRAADRREDAHANVPE